MKPVVNMAQLSTDLLHFKLDKWIREHPCAESDIHQAIDLLCGEEPYDEATRRDVERVMKMPRGHLSGSDEELLAYGVAESNSRKLRRLIHMLFRGDYDRFAEAIHRPLATVTKWTLLHSYLDYVDVRNIESALDLQQGYFDSVENARKPTPKETENHPTRDRLFEAAKKLKGLTASIDVARAIGESPQTVTQWKKRGVSKEGMIKAHRSLGVSLTWLETGVGRMTQMAIDDVSTDLVTLRHYATLETAGYGVSLEGQPGAIMRVDVTRQWLAAAGLADRDPSRLFVLTGFGAAMEPDYPAGNLIIIDSTCMQFAGDDVYFFRLGQIGYLRHLRQIPEKAGIVARASNEDYAAMKIAPENDPAITDGVPGMSFEILGRVVKA